MADEIRFCTPVLDMLSTSAQFGVVSVSDCGNCVCIGSWLRKVADEIRFCTPVLDMLSTSAQFGVVSLSDCGNCVCMCVYRKLAEEGG